MSAKRPNIAPHFLSGCGCFTILFLATIITGAVLISRMRDMAEGANLYSQPIQELSQANISLSNASNTLFALHFHRNNVLHGLELEKHIQEAKETFDEIQYQLDNPELSHNIGELRDLSLIIDDLFIEYKESISNEEQFRNDRVVLLIKLEAAASNCVGFADVNYQNAVNEKRDPGQAETYQRLCKEIEEIGTKLRAIESEYVTARISSDRAARAGARESLEGELEMKFAELAQLPLPEQGKDMLAELKEVHRENAELFDELVKDYEIQNAIFEKTQEMFDKSQDLLLHTMEAMQSDAETRIEFHNASSHFSVVLFSVLGSFSLFLGIIFSLIMTFWAGYTIKRFCTKNETATAKTTDPPPFPQKVE